jgi:hypothetical protein
VQQCVAASGKQAGAAVLEVNAEGSGAVDWMAATTAAPSADAKAGAGPAAAAAVADTDNSSIAGSLPDSARQGRMPLSLPPLVRTGSTASSSGATRPAATSTLLSRRK